MEANGLISGSIFPILYYPDSPHISIFTSSSDLAAELPDEDADNDGQFGEPAGFEVRTGGDSIYFDFDSYWIEANVDYAEASVGGAIQLAGGFTFAKGPVHTVTLTNGDEIEVTA